MNYKITFIYLLFPIIALSGEFTLTMDNDIVGHSDRHYTHGTKFSNAIEYKPDTYWELSIAQYMYTPDNIDSIGKIIGDRPYAGWLYLGNMLSFREGESQKSIELDIGTTGENSLSDQTQIWVHNKLDNKEPKGWHNQLDSKLGINVSLIDKYKHRTVHTDLIYGWNMSAGNIHSSFGLGGLFRFGYNIPDNFGHTKMEPTVRFKNDYGTYVFVGLEGRYVEYNTFLQGSNAEEEYQITKEDFVGEFYMGLGGFYKAINLIYSYNIRGKEFEEQDSINKYGPIIFAIKY